MQATLTPQFQIGTVTKFNLLAQVQWLGGDPDDSFLICLHSYTTDNAVLRALLVQSGLHLIRAWIPEDEEF